MCRQVLVSGEEYEGVSFNPNSFPCTAARKLGKY